MDPINLAAIVKPDLMLLAEELGVKVVKAMRKPEIIKAIEDCGAGADEISECWSEVQKRQREAELHAAQEGLRVAREKLELEMLQRNFDAGEAIVVDNSSKKFDMRALLQPFRVGGDMGLYLVNFERVCVKMGLVESSWPQRLLSLLPAEVADVLARLDPTAADDYASVKSCLLRKFRLSPEAFRQKFQETRKGPDESYAEFAYKLKGFLESWLRGVNSYEDREKVLEQIALEQFLSCIPTGLKEWIQDRPEVETVQKAADYADEYCSRHGKKVVEENRSSNRFYERCGPRTFVKKGAEKGKESEVPTKGVSDSDEKKRKMKALEERKPIVCYRCKQPGHVASGCRVPKVAPVNLCLGEAEDLLRPYLYDMKVNGKFCKGLRDTGATYDLVHSSLVEQEHFTGDCVWIRQALENRAVSLPVAKVKLNGPFGVVETEAAVSDGVLPNCPYILSNRTARQLSESGIPLDMNPVLVVTRSMTTSAVPETLQTEASATTGKTSSGPDEEPNEGADMTTLVSPESSNFRALAGVDKLTLITEQSSDPSLSKCRDSVGKEIKPNISFFMSNGILYRSFKDKSGNEVDQIVVPSKYRIALLELAHGEGWSGHLGIKKTKCRLLAEYYWPGCFKEAEQFVRSCDTCQRTGRPNERRKAPLTLVPIITEPFKRLVIDVVGPLPTTKTGFKYLLTILCPASKFPEAVPMKEQTSVEVVDNLLSVFSRIGFPSEIQCDLGSVFTSALTTSFFERCGIKIVHSSVSHPQSNSVERAHSVMKRILRALCHEQKKEWDLALPAMLFALRTVAHESTGFTPAELVYGRNLRSPLRLLREGWKGEAENPTVVEYVLSLLNRLHKTRELVEANLGKAQSRGKTFYDKNSRLRTFKVGDQVLLLTSSKAHKLELQWEGPATVQQRLSETNYVVKLPGRRKEVRIYHCNLMKPYVERVQVVSIALNQPEEVPTRIPELGKTDGILTIAEVVEAAVDKTLTQNQFSDLTALIGKYQKLFSTIPGRTSLVEHDIKVRTRSYIQCKAYRFSPRQEKLLKESVDQMLELGLIERCESDFVSPMILVETPGKEPRPCVDYRELNAVTVTKVYPIPNIETCLEKVSKAKFISTIDLVRGYWQVPLTANASNLAAFMTPFGVFKPLVLSFGLKNAPYAFSRLMNLVLVGTESFVSPYLDDVAIFSDTWREHVQHLEQVFSRLQDAGLTVKAKKCKFGRGEVSYLGHVVGQGMRRPQELKVQAIKEFPLPQTKKDLMSFIGLVNYYHQYIPQFSEKASPLTDALKKTEPTKIKWDDRKIHAFEALKLALATQPVLVSPDYTRPFLVQCDASEKGLGVVLSQENEGEEHPVLFASRKLTSREQAYSTIEKECACLVWAVEKLRCYLYGSEFIFITDHRPLTWLQQLSPKNGRLLRWSLTLQEYSFLVRHKKGKLHANADCLSRAL